MEANETALCRNTKPECCYFADKKENSGDRGGMRLKKTGRIQTAMEVCAEALNKCYIRAFYVKIQYFCLLNEGVFS